MFWLYSFLWLLLIIRLILEQVTGLAVELATKGPQRREAYSPRLTRLENRQIGRRKPHAGSQLP